MRPARADVLVRSSFAWALGCVGALAAAWSHGARAQSATLDGTWQAGATAIDASVESWGKDCGPAPTSSQSSGGGSVRIEQKGDRLSLIGTGRTIHSDRCFSQNPALARSSAKRDGDTWTTRCATPKDDPRGESGTYTLKRLAPDRLLYQDVSHFRWQLKDSLCVATITTIQTLTRLPAAGARVAPAAPSAPGAASAPEPPPCVPGEPTRLSLAPRRTRIELGQRVCVRARLTDAAGCVVPASSSVRYALEHEPSRRASLLANGCFQAGEQAADGEGVFQVIASYGSLRAQSAIEVVTADLSALVAKRIDLSASDAGAADALEDEQAAPDATPAKPAAPVASSSHGSTRAVAAATASAPWRLSAALLALGAVGLLALGAVWLRTRSRVPTLDSDEGAPSKRPAAAPGMRCPTCGTEYPSGSAFCGNDGSGLVSRDATRSRSAST